MNIREDGPVDPEPLMHFSEIAMVSAFYKWTRVPARARADVPVLYPTRCGSQVPGG